MAPERGLERQRSEVLDAAPFSEQTSGADTVAPRHRRTDCRSDCTARPRSAVTPTHQSAVTPLYRDLPFHPLEKSKLSFHKLRRHFAFSSAWKKAKWASETFRVILLFPGAGKSKMGFRDVPLHFAFSSRWKMQNGLPRPNGVKASRRNRATKQRKSVTT